MRCEYCRQLNGDRLECRRCGAPLPDTESQLTRANIEGTLNYSQIMHNDIEVIIPEGYEMDWDAPGGAMMDYSRRNKINNAIASIAPYKFWAQRSLVNWRIRGEANEPGG